MTLKTFSDEAKTFTFTYHCESYDHSRLAVAGIMGYMLGTYEQPVIKSKYGVKADNGDYYPITVDYVTDKPLDDVFNRICKGLEGSSRGGMEE